MTGTEVVQTIWLGRMAYAGAMELQRELYARRVNDEIGDVVLFLEHEPVITLGRRADETHVLLDADQLSDLGVEVSETDRGGEATYHGPGQLVGYPIIGMRERGLGPVKYVRLLERVIIETLSEFGIAAHLVDGETGVWVEGIPGEKRVEGINPKGKKIAALGVRISSGVSMHGFALNVATDLSMFQNIIPCGMPELPASSIEDQIGNVIGLPQVAKVTAEILGVALGSRIEWTNSIELIN